LGQRRDLRTGDTGAGPGGQDDLGRVAGGGSGVRGVAVEAEELAGQGGDLGGGDAGVLGDLHDLVAQLAEPGGLTQGVGLVLEQGELLVESQRLLDRRTDLGGDLEAEAEDGALGGLLEEAAAAEQAAQAPCATTTTPAAPFTEVDRREALGSALVVE